MASIALISVYDKSGLAPFARALHDVGYTLVSTGGTHSLLADAGLPVRQVSDVTGFPEILDGRVKTLHPRVHGGLLARRDNPRHDAELARHGIDRIDVVVSNLYPFEETIARPGVTMDAALENIDIGGPTLMRAAAKNYPFVTIVSDPGDYGWIGERLAGGGLLTTDERRWLAYKAFRHVSLYDGVVAAYLAPDAGAPLPDSLTLAFDKVYDLRYGENPHQPGALYAPSRGGGGLAGAELLHGKALSFNNLLDADAAARVVNSFREQAVCVIKHTNPCGLACHESQAEAYRRAFEGDTVSAYGGIVGFNTPVTLPATQAMRGVFYEVVVAPDYDPDALALLKRRRNLRIIRLPADHGAAALDLRPVSGGLLVQTSDDVEDDPSQWRVVTERTPTESEARDLRFAWRGVRHLKSNAILLAKDRAMVGMGTGQPNRVTSVHLSLRAAGRRADGAVMASDAFFPFPDNVHTASEGGVTAVIQPGGSLRDQESIDAANERDMAMVFTGTRHFRH